MGEDMIINKIQHILDEVAKEKGSSKKEVIFEKKSPRLVNTSVQVMDQ